MPTPDEKQAFANRLKQALTRSSAKIESPSELALQFNLRHQGEPITPQAAHKWLSGRTMPTTDKLGTLANWLDVPLQWLRFGIPETTAKPRRKPAKKSDLGNMAADETELIMRLRAMPEVRRKLIMDLVQQLSLDGEMWAS
ncbi:transcriptional regulator [Cupriavidus campinensis]|uniref:Transcriptional regulator n=1 Tax=Cupriavidus campinensis TaxID=151783 RepID=A0AAE9I017_9BURK|nr:transcriptional regulator [Cupriavidus campinensis]URF05043.1 transcriptional regulator [Cupriavidus campinensis]